MNPDSLPSADAWLAEHQRLTDALLAHIRAYPSAAPQGAQPVSQVRMLTVEEIVAVSKEMVPQREFVDGSFANAIQLKSFEVNAGLTIRAKAA